MKRFLAISAATALLFSSTASFADSLGSAAGGVAANQSSLSGGIYRATPPTLTDGQQAGMQFDTNGNLKIVTSGTPVGTQNVQGTGTAGTPAGGVLTIQGQTGATPLNVNPDSVVDSATGLSNAVASATNFTFTGTQVPFTSTPATNISTAGFQALQVQILGNASSNTITIEGSNDGGSTWTALTSVNIAATGVNQPAASITAGTGITVTVPNLMALVRVRVSNFVGGTTTLAVTFKRAGEIIPGALQQIVAGSVASGASDSGNPVKIGGVVTTGGAACTNGQRCNTQSTTIGSTVVSAAPSVDTVVDTSDTHCTAACASVNVSGVHNLYGLNFSATVPGWLLLYDATACAANGTVAPLRTYAYPTAGVTATVTWGDLPRGLATGLSACFSSTGPFTATASTTAFIAADYK